MLFSAISIDVLKVKTDPLSLGRYCGYFAILKVAILEEELIRFDHFRGVFLQLALRVSEAGWFRRAIGEIDSDKGFVVLWVEIAWVFIDIVDGATFPSCQSLGLRIMTGFAL